MAESTQTPLDASQPKNGKRKILLLALTVFFIAAGLGYGMYYNQVLSQREETDNAYVSGNLVTLTPQVSGIVTDIMADETQQVIAGQDVIKLDPADAAIALKHAEAQLGEAVRSIRQQFANVNQYTAAVAQRKVDLTRAQEDYSRRAPLLKERAVSAEDVEHARQAISTAQQALNIAEKQLEAARSGVEGVTIAEHPSVLKARANFEQAYLATQRNTLVAPVTGYIAKRSVQVGQRIAPGASLMSIVPLNALWVDANFKEPELRNIRIGQPAVVETDLYGSKVVYHGKVVGLAAGTGAAFSLLPAQNATGNWIKVIQRVPVRIALTNDEIKAHPLRVGLSASVTVDTHHREGAMLSSASNAKPVYTTQVYEKPLKDADRIADQIISRNAGVSVVKSHHG